MLEAVLEFMQLALLLVQVLDQSPPALLHLVQSPLESDPEGRDVFLPLADFVVGVLRVPYVVGDKLFEGAFPAVLEVRVVDVLNFAHKSVNVLNKNVVSCDEDALLLLGRLGLSLAES